MSSSSSTNSRTAATAATATVATYTDKLSEKINEEFKEFNKTIQSIHANSAEPIQEIIKLIQDNNKRTLELFQESIQKLFKDLLDSVHTHFSLDRNQEQIKQIDNQIISNTLNADSETRIRLQSILIQQKQELVNQRNQLKHHLQHLPTITTISDNIQIQIYIQIYKLQQDHPYSITSNINRSSQNRALQHQQPHQQNLQQQQ
ncbi:hypothetical protein H4Q26_007778 [Puccinia striiformis f. sp. tritici PST-130]|nr:hypothetical protein H4Q26_007778 [Puccinia striiformis f. sp. tritici PST-130]